VEKVGRKQDVEFIAGRRESIYEWCCVGGLKSMMGLEDKEKKASDTQMNKHGVCVCVCVATRYKIRVRIACVVFDLGS